MKIIILGSDGYIGYPLFTHLKSLGHEVYGIDDYSRRKLVHSLTGATSLTPINQRPSLFTRANVGSNYNALVYYLKEIQPDTIVHLAQQPSAPWSMQSVDHAVDTQVDNITSTLHIIWAMKEACPTAHLVKLGSMGEYGTPECDIPEGEIPNFCSDIRMEGKQCPMSGLPFPRSPFSFYHLSKVHDTHNIIFASKNWELTCTDIMQGVVFGVSVTDSETDKELTRFDYDQYFGTAINRFCAQAISGHNLTVYGDGSQTRGFLPLKDSIQCLTLAITNPPHQGEYRTLNQFENIYSIWSLAKMVVKASFELGIGVQIENLPNPRIEKSNHYYRPAHKKLFNLGYIPTTGIFQEIKSLITDILPYQSNINKSVFMPTTMWNETVK